MSALLLTILATAGGPTAEAGPVFLIQPSRAARTPRRVGPCGAADCVCGCALGRPCWCRAEAAPLRPVASLRPGPAVFLAPANAGPPAAFNGPPATNAGPPARVFYLIPRATAPRPALRRRPAVTSAHRSPGAVRAAPPARPVFRPVLRPLANAAACPT
jgi:hypothetical protein